MFMCTSFAGQGHVIRKGHGQVTERDQDQKTGKCQSHVIVVKDGHDHMTEARERKR